MDYRRLAAELLRALRGSRSQAAFNRRLGYSTNVAHTWESAKRQPTARLFFELTGDAGKEVVSLLREFSQEQASSLQPRLPSVQWVPAFLGDLRGATRVSEVARSLGRPRHTVARWFSGATELKLSQLLELVEVLTSRLVEFCALFCAPSQLPSLAAAWRHLQHQKRLAAQAPWSHAVLRALELDSYRNADDPLAALARATGLGKEEGKRLLELLITAGQAVKAESGRWEPVEVLTVDTGGYEPDVEAQKAHWARVALERFGADRLGDGLFSYNLCSVSEDDYERIRQVHIESFNQIRSIVAASKPSERLVLVQKTVIPLDA